MENIEPGTTQVMQYAVLFRLTSEYAVINSASITQPFTSMLPNSMDTVWKSCSLVLTLIVPG